MNGGSYLRECIESVLSQQIADMEVLVGDNASDDDTSAIATSFQDPRLRLIRYEERLEMCANWNRLLAEARGEWIKLLPCDDRLTVGAMQRELDAIKPGIALIAGGKIVCARSGRKMWVSRRTASGHFPGATMRSRLLRAPGNLLGEPGSVLFRLEDWKRCGKFNESLHYFCDVEFYARLLACGDLIVLEKPSGMFRVHGGSMSAKQFRRIAKEYHQFRELYSLQPADVLQKTRLKCSTVLRQACIIVLNRL